MIEEQKNWEDVVDALDRIFDLCEEIDPQSEYRMAEDTALIRDFIYKHNPKTKKPLPSKIEKEIEVEIKGKKYLISNWDFIRGWNACIEEITK